ncbi:MAG TPA: hypothetical protein PLB89_05150 [Flavobacteriales bacterium]|nr:hypothetical protein [Flavobacteriales bacterium]
MATHYTLHENAANIAVSGPGVFVEFHLTERAIAERFRNTLQLAYDAGVSSRAPVKVEDVAWPTAEELANALHEPLLTILKRWSKGPIPEPLLHGAPSPSEGTHAAGPGKNNHQ